MSTNSNSSYSWKQLTATNQVSGNPVTPNSGTIGRIIVSSTTAGTIQVYDGNNGTTGATLLLDTWTPTAGSAVTLEAAYTKGIYIVVTGVISFTVFYN